MPIPASGSSFPAGILARGCHGNGGSGSGRKTFPIPAGNNGRDNRDGTRPFPGISRFIPRFLPAFSRRCSKLTLDIPGSTDIPGIPPQPLFSRWEERIPSFQNSEEKSQKFLLKINPISSRFLGKIPRIPVKIPWIPALIPIPALLQLLQEKALRIPWILPFSSIPSLAPSPFRCSWSFPFSFQIPGICLRKELKPIHFQPTLAIPGIQGQPWLLWEFLPVIPPIAALLQPQSIPPVLALQGKDSFPFFPGAEGFPSLALLPGPSPSGPARGSLIPLLFHSFSLYFLSLSFRFLLFPFPFPSLSPSFSFPFPSISFFLSFPFPSLSPLLSPFLFPSLPFSGGGQAVPAASQPRFPQPRSAALSPVPLFPGPFRCSRPRSAALSPVPLSPAPFRCPRPRSAVPVPVPLPPAPVASAPLPLPSAPPPLPRSARRPRSARPPPPGPAPLPAPLPCLAPHLSLPPGCSAPAGRLRFGRRCPARRFPRAAAGAARSAPRSRRGGAALVPSPSGGSAE
ncbi:proline-rich protein 36-like [Poecile atricapillus]|uniref:proline-rich protein 36-like n=1 Tax=Poecile atricapillus TaxID=48891 RepID=UPI002738C965|nr:proline-rich protein 36-like [Poecile atricapillus]